MRVVFLIDQLWDPLAGTENQLIKLIRGMGPHHDVHLICLRSTAWLEREASKLPCTIKTIQVDRLRHWRTYANILALWSYLRKLQPDVVHTFFPVGNIVGVLAARLAGVTAVVASRRDFGEWMTPRYLRFTRVANKFVMRIVTNSAEVKRLTVRREGFAADRIDVIPNSIDLDTFEIKARNNRLREQLGVPIGGKLIGLVANYRPMKRHETLVRAARLIVDQRDDVRFVLVGRNATSEDLEGQTAALIERLGLCDHVRQTHAAGTIVRVLAALDIAVNCSQGEGLSNAVMECMAARVPCVVAASGGNTDLVIHDQTGLTFELDNAEELAARIMSLVDQPDLADRLADAAFRRLRLEMTTDVVLGRFETFYRGLVAEKAVVAQLSTFADVNKGLHSHDLERRHSVAIERLPAVEEVFGGGADDTNELSERASERQRPQELPGCARPN